MYKTAYFTEHDMQTVTDFVKANPFATLIGNHNNRSVATQVPLLITEREGKLILRGHMMRKSDHHIALEGNSEALVLFTGPHCYVSAGWYAERGVGGTWNYLTVHARGQIKFFDGTETLKILTELTHKYEDNKPKPELVENMTDEYLQTHIKAIAGFEIVVDDLYPLFKLSQNRSDDSYRNIVNELLATGNNEDIAIANEMKKRRPQLF